MKVIAQHLLGGLCAVAAAMPVLATEHGERGFRGGPGERGEHAARGEHGQRQLRIEPWHGDIHHFHDRDLPAWRNGRWIHGMHGGRDGWWWVVGLTWYWYPTPVYPYPDPYLPPPAAEIAPPAPAAPPQYWYYCANPPGYYPYVPQCYGNWQRVPATPP